MMDCFISSLQGIRLSSSSLENGLPMYCISVNTNARYAYGSTPFAFAVSIRLYTIALDLAPLTVSENSQFETLSDTALDSACI